MTDYEQMVEKAARAMYDYAAQHEKSLMRWDAAETTDRLFPLLMARATLSAIGLTPESVIVPREPTEGMKFAGGLAFENAIFGEGAQVFDAAGVIYEAMLAEALAAAKGNSA